MNMKLDDTPTAVERLDSLAYAISNCLSKVGTLRSAYWDGKITFNEYITEMQNIRLYGEMMEKELNND